MDGDRGSKLAGSNSAHVINDETVPSKDAKDTTAIWEGKITLKYLDHIISKKHVRDARSKKMEMKKLLLEMLLQSKEMLRLSREMQRQSELFLASDFCERSGGPA